jgi:hypothetical protein
MLPARLGLKADRSREKPEFSPAQIDLIRAKLKQFKKPEWMKISFEIAIHQGCNILVDSALARTWLTDFGYAPRSTC